MKLSLAIAVFCALSLIGSAALAQMGEVSEPPLSTPPTAKPAKKMRKSPRPMRWNGPPPKPVGKKPLTSRHLPESLSLVINEEIRLKLALAREAAKADEFDAGYLKGKQEGLERLNKYLLGSVIGFAGATLMTLFFFFSFLVSFATRRGFFGPVDEPSCDDSES